MANLMTDKLSAIVEAHKSRLEGSTFGFRGVWIGDETLIPGTPAVSIVGGPKSRNIAETGFTTINTFDVTFVIYHAELGSQNLNRLECIRLAENIEAFIHEDKQLGGLVYTSHCTSVEPGFSERGQQIMVSTRIDWQGRSKTRI